MNTTREKDFMPWAALIAVCVVLQLSVLLLPVLYPAKPHQQPAVSVCVCASQPLHDSVPAVVKSTPHTPTAPASVAPTRKRYTRSDAVLYTDDLLYQSDTIHLRGGAKIRIRFYDAEQPIDFDYTPPHK